MRLACFVTPHGYGHATRARAVLDALAARGAVCGVELYSRVPRRLYSDLAVPVALHPYRTDIGLVQHDSLSIDVEGSLRELAALIPFDETQVAKLADSVAAAGCEAVLCDISALGIAVAERAGLPSVLVENFTWDWIYRRLGDDRFAYYADYLESWYRRASARVRTKPACGEEAADLVVGPMCRKPRQDRDAIRSRLGCAADCPLVLISMGGMSQGYPFVEALRRRPEIQFVFAGHQHGSLHGNIRFLDAEEVSDHPGLVAAADVLIGKIGYSTLAEAYQAGTPFGCFTRPGYPEMPPLESFIADRMPAVVLPADSFYDGGWLRHLDDLLAMSRAQRTPSTAADEIASLVVQRAGGGVSHA